MDALENVLEEEVTARSPMIAIRNAHALDPSQLHCRWLVP